MSRIENWTHGGTSKSQPQGLAHPCLQYLDDYRVGNKAKFVR
jgi:hypothetical protein